MLQLTKEQLSALRRAHPEGLRVKLVQFGLCGCGDPLHDDTTAVPPGTEGAVANVDDAGTVHVRWDNGRNLGLISGLDTWRTM